MDLSLPTAILAWATIISLVSAGQAKGSVRTRNLTILPIWAGRSCHPQAVGAIQGLQ